MKSKYTLLTLLFFFVLSGCQLTKKVAKTSLNLDLVKTSKSLLWEIKGNKLKESSYIYGTIHLIEESDYFLTEATKRAFSLTESVVFEINVEEIKEPSKLMSLIFSAQMPNGIKLQDLMSKEEYLYVESFFEKKGLPMVFLDKIKPLFLSALSAGNPKTTTEGQINQMKSYELEFLKIAKKQNKPIGGLETAEFQISLFDTIPLTEQANILLSTLKNKDTSEDNKMDKLVELYKAQDIHKLKNMLSDKGQNIIKYENILLIKRNIKWIPIMKKMMTKQSTFFAVGAGHLSGKKGLLQLIQKEGYIVNPIFNDKDLDIKEKLN